MSTYYFLLKIPFTSARCTVGGGHTQLALWVNHGKAGEITLRNEEVPSVLLALAHDVAIGVRHANGEHGGELKFATVVEPQTILVSEHGELTCRAELESDRRM